VPEGDEPPVPEGDAFPWLRRAGKVGGGAAIGYGVVVVGFAAIGLSPLGPVAGGLFAANMGAGLTAGGFMATLQGAAMTATAYWGGATVGAAVGGLV